MSCVATRPPSASHPDWKTAVIRRQTNYSNPVGQVPPTGSTRSSQLLNPALANGRLPADRGVPGLRFGNQVLPARFHHAPAGRQAISHFLIRWAFGNEFEHGFLPTTRSLARVFNSSRKAARRAAWSSRKIRITAEGLPIPAPGPLASRSSYASSNLPPKLRGQARRIGLRWPPFYSFWHAGALPVGPHPRASP